MSYALDPCDAEVPWGDCAKECLNPLNWLRLPIPRKFGAASCALNSFTRETLVQIKPEDAQAGEAQQGKVAFKAIDQIEVGDEVLALAEWKDKGREDDLDQRLSYEKVVDILTSSKEQRLVYLTLDTGETIAATDGHPFKTTEGWRDAILLKKGGKLLLKGAGETDPERAEGKDAERTATITDVRIEKKTVKVYNLEVANDHTFFVGEDGVAVHNASCKGIAHGDDGRALERAKKVAQAIIDKAKSKSKKERNREMKKAQNIIEAAQKKGAGETHGIKGY